MPVCSQLLILLFAATDFLHRTVQILVTIYIWNCGCLMSLNNIEQTATKPEQQWNYRARRVSCGDVLNRLAGFKPRILRSASAAFAIACVAIARSMPRCSREDLSEEGDHEEVVHL